MEACSSDYGNDECIDFMDSGYYLLSGMTASQKIYRYENVNDQLAYGRDTVFSLNNTSGILINIKRDKNHSFQRNSDSLTYARYKY